MNGFIITRKFWLKILNLCCFRSEEITYDVEIKENKDNITNFNHRLM